MAYKRLNPRLMKMNYSYSVEEIAALYSLHPNTVRHWLKTGLRANDGTRPLLVKGTELRRFLEKRRATSKSPCPPGTLYCFRCRAPREPALGVADFFEREDSPGNLQALCESCGALMNRRTRQDQISILLPDVEVSSRGIRSA